MFLITSDQIETYFVNEAAPRSNLLRYGFKTMIDYFPLGSGLATYGTDAAVKYYSPLYYKYGFANVYGLSPAFPMYAHDTYWPAIFAEFGLIGALLLGLYLFKLFKSLLNKVKNDKYAYMAVIFVCITQLSSSIATATFFNFVTCALFFVLPLAITDSNKVE